MVSREEHGITQKTRTESGNHTVFSRETLSATCAKVHLIGPINSAHATFASLRDSIMGSDVPIMVNRVCSRFEMKSKNNAVKRQEQRAFAS